MFHKKHHTFRAPIALAATYAHPLETILNNALPLIAGPLLCRSHVVTYWLWLVVAIVGTMHHHSGYRYVQHEPATGCHPSISLTLGTLAASRGTQPSTTTRTFTTTTTRSSTATTACWAGSTGCMAPT